VAPVRIDSMDEVHRALGMIEVDVAVVEEGSRGRGLRGRQGKLRFESPRMGLMEITVPADAARSSLVPGWAKRNDVVAMGTSPRRRHHSAARGRN
jgi:hypothetical protein